MKVEDIINRLNESKFNKNEYWVVAGAAMVLHGIKKETNDIDLGCTTAFADYLEIKYNPIIFKDGIRNFQIGVDIEVFENWIADKIVLLSGIPTISINGLIEMKKTLGREKDLKDIEIIKQHLKSI